MICVKGARLDEMTGEDTVRLFSRRVLLELSLYLKREISEFIGSQDK